MVQNDEALSVTELNLRLSAIIASSPQVRNIRVVGETSDLRVSCGHCYMELVEKDERGGNRSRIRAIAWASTWTAINRRFMAVTGSQITSGMKIMATVTATYHQTYGMSVQISDIDPNYTLGDAVRRRNEILQRLVAEGIAERNRQLRWPIAPVRIAIISAAGAAGYGDFMTHLYTHPSHYRFDVELFAATMQGEQTVPTVMAALKSIADRADEFDAVVIIRGGGATSDLAAFDNYDLARAVALFPLPIIVGIGHERDVTVLDYIANQRVKTPTAAAEWLIARVQGLMDALDRVADKIYRAAWTRISLGRELLAQAAASLPGLATATIMREKTRLDRTQDNILNSSTLTLERAKNRLEQIEKLTEALSPESVLKRGFSMTMLPDGRIVHNADDVEPGTILTTRLQTGAITSKTL